MSKTLDNTGGTPLFDPVRHEEAEKRRILNRHEENHAHTLEWLRERMVALWQTRALRDSQASVSANDARKVLEEYRIPTGPWMGALFRSKGWENTGQIEKSTALGSHARILWLYRWEPRNG